MRAMKQCASSLISARNSQWHCRYAMTSVPSHPCSCLEVWLKRAPGPAAWGVAGALAWLPATGASAYEVWPCELFRSNCCHNMVPENGEVRPGRLRNPDAFVSAGRNWAKWQRSSWPRCTPSQALFGQSPVQQVRWGDLRQQCSGPVWRRMGISAAWQIGQSAGFSGHPVQQGGPAGRRR